MNKKKIFFKTKASDYDGWGNLQRQFNIYELLEKRKFEVLFFFQGSNKGYNFLKKKCNTIRIPKKISFTEEFKLISYYGKCDYFIIEQLHIPITFQKKIKTIAQKLIIFDDLLQNKYFCDKLFCCQENANFNKVKNNHKNKIIKFYYGYKYFPISKDLLKARNNKSKIKKNNNILISLGGGDYDEYILNCIDLLISFKNHFDFILIFLKGSFKNSTVKKLSKFKFVKIKKDKNSIVNELQKSKISILSGGYHKIESNYLDCNSIFIATQKHQNVLLHKFHKKTQCDYIKFRNSNFKKLLLKYLTKRFFKKSLINKLSFNNKYLLNNLLD